MEKSIKSLFAGIFLITFIAFCTSFAMADITCYQETANASSSADGNCGLDYGGNYHFGGNWTNKGLPLIDGDWNSYDNHTLTRGGIYRVIYNLPAGVNPNGSVWQVKDESGTKNISLPYRCWNSTSPLILVVISYPSIGLGRPLTYACWNYHFDNGLPLAYLLEVNATMNFYEEAMIWNITDATAPTTTNDETGGWHTAVYNLTLNATDSLPSSGINYTSYLYNGVWHNSTSNPTIIQIDAEGNNSLTYFSVDNAGNKENDTTVYVALDTIVPLLNIDYPLNTIYSYNVTELNYTASDSELQACWYSLDLGITNSTAVACGTNFSGLNSVEGSNTWTVWANDSAGNINNDSITFIVDATLPTANIIYDINNLTNQNVTATLNASEPVTITNNGGNVNYTFASDGVFNFTFTDAAGNAGSALANVSWIDKIAPAINFTNQTTLTGTYNDVHEITVNVSAFDANFANLTLNIYNSANLTSPIYTSNTSINETFLFYQNSTLDFGTYYIDAIAYDLAGNVNTNRTTIVLQATPPSPSGGGGCTSNWTYTQWGSCVNGTQTRVYYDSKRCSYSNKTESQICIVYTLPPTSNNTSNLTSQNQTNETENTTSFIERGRSFITGAVTGVKKGFTSTTNTIKEKIIEIYNNAMKIDRTTLALVLSAIALIVSVMVFLWVSHLRNIFFPKKGKK